MTPIPESEIETRAESLDNLCREKVGELGIDPVTATNLVLLHKVAELELRFEASAKADVIHCECGGILEQVMLAEFDMSDFGISRVLHDVLGYRCNGCGGVTVGGEVINAAMLADTGDMAAETVTPETHREALSLLEFMCNEYEQHAVDGCYEATEVLKRARELLAKNRGENGAVNTSGTSPATIQQRARFAGQDVWLDADGNHVTETGGR